MEAPNLFYYYLKNIYFLNLEVVLGLHCCMRAFSSCSKRGLLFLVLVHGLLIAVTSLLTEHGL